MAVYYIDNLNGRDVADGLSAQSPKRDYTALSLESGDSVLFKCGSFYRGQLKMVGGADGAPITYGSYGEGELPVFSGGIDVSGRECWMMTDRKNVWKCVKEIPTDVGNFILSGKCSATLRWDRTELSADGDFFDSRFGECNVNQGVTCSPQEVLLYSDGHPCDVFSQIEAVPYAKRTLGGMKSNTVIENLAFINSGVHALTGVGDTKNVVIRGCRFENIGGCVWSLEEKIRFGNGIEFWIGAENIEISHCTFKNIYDSCATHQGPDYETPPARNFHVRGCTFDTYSMAAFEYRAQMMVDSSFTGNICKNAGCGFGMLGESLPRKSEIWPQPMGHHIFFWRIWEAVDDIGLLVADNVFDNAPNGSAVYSIICAEAEAGVTFKNNKVIGDYLTVAHWGGVDLDKIPE